MPFSNRCGTRCSKETCAYVHHVLVMRNTWTTSDLYTKVDSGSSFVVSWSPMSSLCQSVMHHVHHSCPTKQRRQVSQAWLANRVTGTPLSGCVVLSIKLVVDDSHMFHSTHIAEQIPLDITGLPWGTPAISDPMQLPNFEINQSFEHFLIAQHRRLPGAVLS